MESNEQDMPTSAEPVKSLAPAPSPAPAEVYPSFKDLAKINVNAHTEKKNNLTYLSWAWAVDQLLRQDEYAVWEYGEPQRWNDTVMVFCSVTAFKRTRTAQLPVMDHRNRPIPNPDAFQVNTAMQRCLAKAIALFGIGLYIYAGEDLPMDVAEESKSSLAADVQRPADLAEPIVTDASDDAKSHITNVIKELEAAVTEVTLADEAECVGWMVHFMTEWVTEVADVAELRNFWTANKEARSRIKVFSKPQHDVLEAMFKTKALQLKGTAK